MAYKPNHNSKPNFECCRLLLLLSVVVVVVLSILYWWSSLFYLFFSRTQIPSWSVSSYTQYCLTAKRPRAYTNNLSLLHKTCFLRANWPIDARRVTLDKHSDDLLGIVTCQSLSQCHSCCPITTAQTKRFLDTWHIAVSAIMSLVVLSPNSATIRIRLVCSPHLGRSCLEIQFPVKAPSTCRGCTGRELHRKRYYHFFSPASISIPDCQSITTDCEHWGSYSSWSGWEKTAALHLK